MRSVHYVFFAVYALLCTSSAMASGLGDILRQSTGVVVDTERNRGSTIIDAERRKQSIDTDAQRQVSNLDTYIDANERRISDELEPQMMDARIDLRAIERDRVNGLISRMEYSNQKRDADMRISNIRNSIAQLKQQNAEYARRKKEVLANAEAQKRQVDVDARANADQATTRQNTNILDQVIRGIGR